MTNPEFTLAYDTVRHLDRWLDRNLVVESFESREAVRDAMLKLVATDEDHWLAKGWQAVHDKAWWGYDA